VFPFSPLAIQALPQTSIVHVRNRTTGPAMSLLKNATQGLPICESQKDSVRSGRWNNPIEQILQTLTFVEDFTLEHSLPGLHITSIENSGSF